MNIEKLERDVQSLAANPSKSDFIYDLLSAYEVPKASITRLKKGDYNLSKTEGEVLWRKKLCFKHETEIDLYSCIDRLKNDSAVAKLHPRFIVVTDFETLLAVDTTTNDTLDTPILALAKYFDFFLPWAGMEKSQLQSENPADIKAAERMGRLYDLILKDNPPKTDLERHSLNIFLSRLLFCFFAEDTDIFLADQFTNAVASHTVDDGSDLQAYLQKLFEVLSTEERSDYPQFLQSFPYVNGGLFSDEHPVPTFNAKSRKIIIECGGLNWKAINPDIFGSMIQAVVHHSERGSLGIHYTSVINIMKVIEPLFLNELHADLEQAGDSKKKLSKLLHRLYRLRFFDPACGSGNFLIIAYKELCKLETDIFRRMHGEQRSFQFASRIQLTQFYGIEIDDFAHETAKLSLWLAEHQMNLAFKEVFDTARLTLPLQDGAQIVCGNATRIDWEAVCPKKGDADVYVLGNPPYLGARNQTKEQKEDVRSVLIGVKGVNSVDYISCWFFKAACYLRDTKFRCAFVTTNSVCQGEQVSLLWPHVLKDGIEIGFAHQSFRWTNNARGNAGVTCMVVGLRSQTSEPKYILTDGFARSVDNISPYIANTETVYVFRRSAPLSHLPQMTYGNQPVEGGYLSLVEHEYTSLLEEYPETRRLIRKLIGGTEFLKGQKRWCIWIENPDLEYALKIPPIKERIQGVQAFRESGGEVARSLVDRSHQFRYRHEANQSFILVPRTSSENRQCIPVGFFDREFLTLDSAQIVYDPRTWIFAMLSSKIHMIWARAVGGRLKLDPRYSSALCYNTFPFPRITSKQETDLEGHVFSVLEERERYSEMTVAELYDPKKMPDGLRHAHREMDLAVEQCYRQKPFKSDQARLSFLFKLYQEMIETERNGEAGDA